MQLINSIGKEGTERYPSILVRTLALISVAYMVSRILKRVDCTTPKSGSKQFFKVNLLHY